MLPPAILLGERLPPLHVLRIDGGHDWDIWVALWEKLLDRFIPEH